MTEQSDFSSLSATSSKKSRMYTCRKWLETVAILVGLIGGGTGLGYYFGIQQGDAAHISEIDRLRDVYRENLAVITRDVKSAANSVETAAIQMDDVVNTTSQIANKIAKQSTRPTPSIVFKTVTVVIKPTISEVVKPSSVKTPNDPLYSR